MEAVNTSEASVNFCETTWRYVPEDSHLHLVNFLYEGLPVFHVPQCYKLFPWGINSRKKYRSGVVNYCGQFRNTQWFEVGVLLPRHGAWCWYLSLSPYLLLAPKCQKVHLSHFGKRWGWTHTFSSNTGKILSQHSPETPQIELKSSRLHC